MKSTNTGKDSDKQLRPCRCPFCEEEVALEPSPFCVECKVALRYCPSCRVVVERSATKCPRCGSALT